MRINIVETQNTIGKHSSVKITVSSNIGLQGPKGADSYPSGGQIGNILERQENGVGWTNQPRNLSLNGGNF